MPKKELIKVQKEGKHIIINALPEESYNEQHIPTSVNLPVKDLTKKNRDKKITEFIQKEIN